MMKLTFVDKNKALVKKVKKLFDNYRGTRELDTFCWDVFEYKKLHPEFKIATASNPQFTMWAGLDKAIAEKYPQEIGQLREFWITDNLFWLVSVDENIKTDIARIKRCLAGVYAYRCIINIILTGIWTGIWWLSEEDFISELSKMLSANLSSVNLSSANLHSANLRSANLSYADLNYADLRSADLSSANLRYANLSYANLRSADLSYANLSYANLSSANLRYANLKKTISNELTANFNVNCPEEWSFIWWKKCRDWCIVKLLIPEDAKRSSATTRKCRCDKAVVIAIFDSQGNEVNETVSSRDSNFVYKKGETVKVNDFDEDRWNECSTGIHFFITRREAEQR